MILFEKWRTEKDYPQIVDKIVHKINMDNYMLLHEDVFRTKAGTKRCASLWNKKKSIDTQICESYNIRANVRKLKLRFTRVFIM